MAVAVAVAGGCSSSLTPSLGTSMCHGFGCKKPKKKRDSCAGVELDNPGSDPGPASPFLIEQAEQRLWPF